ncbi:hypothetical protein ACVMB0_007667 [Bradyrhizobium sp. USDA 4451]
MSSIGVGGTPAPVGSIVRGKLNWNSKAYLDAVQYDHRFEPLDVTIFVEETARELLVLLHGSGGNVQDEVGIARDIKAIGDVGCDLMAFLYLSMISALSRSRVTSAST